MCCVVRQDSILVAGYPLGGDSLSITKGIVSRVTMTRYAHASNKLLGIQIDAAINPGNSGGPAFSDLDAGKASCLVLQSAICSVCAVCLPGFIAPASAWLAGKGQAFETAVLRVL